jgi:clostripain
MLMMTARIVMNKQTQTAVDNTKVVALKTAFDAFAVAYSGVTTTLESVRGSGTSPITMNYMEGTSSSYWVACPFFDLYDFAHRMNVANANVTASNLKTAIEDFIIYSYGGSSYKGYTSGAATSAGTTDFQPGKNGLSFFFTDGDSLYNSYSCISYQWWYTSVKSSAVSGSYYYGKLDFCETGSISGSVENWYELIMAMYLTPTLQSSGFWPNPAY